MESAVGAHLLNTIRGTQIEVFYWREGDEEVDFILRRGNSLTAIEVKSNSDTLRHSGMNSFINKFKPTRCLLIGNAGIPLEEFLTTSIDNFIE